MLTKMMTALIATTMLALAMGSSGALAQSNGHDDDSVGCIPQYDSSGAQVSPYCTR